MFPGGDSQPEPSAPQPLVFPERLDGYHLVAARTGDPGDNRIALTLPKPSRVFAISAACRGPQGQLDTRLVVNGTNVGGASCTPNPAAVSGQDPSPGFIEKDFRANGVDLAQRPLALSLTLVQGRFTQVPASDPGTVLGVAVYERDG